MTKIVSATLECSNCGHDYEVEEHSQKELDERLEHLNDEENEMERMCDCCEQGVHFPRHSDIENELQYPNWADNTGFYISVECSKCGEECNVEFEMRSDCDIEVEN
mgnify:FL=1